EVANEPFELGFHLRRHQRRRSRSRRCRRRGGRFALAGGAGPRQKDQPQGQPPPRPLGQSSSIRHFRCPESQGPIYAIQAKRLGFSHRLTGRRAATRFRASLRAPVPFSRLESVMKVRNSLRSLKKRDKDCRIIRRKGRVYVINKKNPRFKARQG